MTPLRILLVTHYYPPEVGAPQRRLGAFVKHWCDAGATVRVITALPHYPTNRLLPGARWGQSFRRETGRNGEQIVRVPFLPSDRTDGLPKMLDHLSVGANALIPALVGDRPDVVLTSAPTLPSIPVGFAAARRYRVPFALEMRDAWPDLLYEADVGGGAGRDLVAAAVRRLQREADAVITVTEGFGEVLASQGVDAARIVHISNGIDPEEVPFAPPRTFAPPLRVLYLGTHGVSQDLGTAVRALAQVGPSRVTARFVGDGSEKSMLRELAATTRAPVTFEDPVRGDALWEAYRWADTCLVPLRDWPMFDHTVPSKLYELMAVGRPILAALSGEARRTAEAAGAGVVVTPGDVDGLAAAIDDLVDRPEALDIGRRARTWVAEHASYEVLADRYLRFLQRLSDDRPTRRLR